MKPSSFVLTAAALLSLALAVTPSAAATGSKFKILHNFTGGSDGGGPVLFAALAMDKNGNLFGATAAGGYYEQDCPYGCGAVFEMVRGTGGRWKESVLFELTDPTTQGYIDSPLALDSQGDLYGCNDRGPMFELTAGSPQWTFNPIWPGGCVGPVGLILDSLGDLYGEFGKGSTGGVSELTPSSNGWAYENLYEFCQQRGCPDGDDPEAPFSWDSKGNLYGTTYFGGYSRDGCSNCGVAFQMTPNGDGTWTYLVMHRFTAHNDGAYPLGSLTVDSAGNAYGTTTHAGPYDNGNVFKLAPAKGGQWKLTVLYGFPNENNGTTPGSNLVFDTAGNLYGVAGTPACGGACGVVFKLSPQKNGKWNYSVLHQFTMTDGDFPNGLTMDSQGHLYGTTRGGGKYNHGVVFELTP
jgi:uncharacterized repeat protein (TIGR03803 family)